MNRNNKDIQHILLSRFVYHANKAPLIVGRELLKKPNKTEEEKVAAKSFKKIMNCVKLAFSAALIPIVLATAALVISITSGGNSEITMVSVYVLLVMMILAPIIMVSAGLIPRSTFGAPFREYYNKYYDKYGNRKEIIK